MTAPVLGYELHHQVWRLEVQMLPGSRSGHIELAGFRVPVEDRAHPIAVTPGEMLSLLRELENHPLREFIRVKSIEHLGRKVTTFAEVRRTVAWEIDAFRKRDDERARIASLTDARQRAEAAEARDAAARAEAAAAAASKAAADARLAEIEG